jgi:CSLREA domain-containing protein
LLLGLVLTAAFGNAGAAIVQIHANNTSITIPASGATTPYPSDILISGITGNLITQVAVQLNGLSHTFPADLDVLLVGPGGERVMLLSDAGSSAAISDVNLLFSPTATASPPQASQLVTGTVLPANYANDANSSDFTDPFPNPAPDVLDREPADLTVFNGTNPNGTWSLYVSDDFQGADGGTIATGWTLFLTVPTIFTVTKTADTNDGVCDGDCSLREAISAASAATGNNDLIAFSGLFLTPQTIVLGGSALNIGESMTVQGPGADLLTISANHASSAFAVGGPGTVTLRGLAIRNGMTSGDGGGIYSEAAQLNLHNVAVAGNYASASGAGVFMFGGRNQFTSCIFNDNQSVESGSAILQYADVNAELKLVNTTISGNRSNSQAALWLFEAGDGTAALDILNSTIAHNSGTDGGGIAVTTLSNSNAQANVSLRNTILANNGARNIQTETQGGGPITINSLGFNLTNEDTGGHFDQATDLVGVDPRLGPLTNNGGQTESHALMGGSPALDAGVRTGYQRDQRGQLRAFDAPGVDTASGSDGSDIGALEMQAIVVAFSDDTSLRQAILDANAAAPAHSDILFNPDWFSSPRIINLESALPAIATSVNIVGPGSKFANVHRSGAGDYRIFEVMNADGREFSISGLAISNGSWPGTGGGIYSIPRTALTEVNVFNNYSTVSGGGGAELGRATIKDSTFALNSALGLGSALYVAGSGSTPGHVRVINSTFFGNVGGPAPGIALVSQFGQSNTLELINSTITSNSGSSDGGLRVHTAGSGSSTATAFVRNSIVAGNTFPNLNATSSGGGASVIDSRGYNLTNDASASYFDQATDKFNTNPLLGGLQDNGGPTTTVALLPNSPALDAGGRSGYLSDQRRLKRPVDQTLIINAADGNGSDIGAVEMVPELVFKNGFEQ